MFRHGTRCAGEVAALANNNECGVGVAFKVSWRSWLDILIVEVPNSLSPPELRLGSFESSHRVDEAPVNRFCHRLHRALPESFSILHVKIAFSGEHRSRLSLVQLSPWCSGLGRELLGMMSPVQIFLHSETFAKFWQYFDKFLESAKVIENTTEVKNGER